MRSADDFVGLIFSCKALRLVLGLDWLDHGIEFGLADDKVILNRPCKHYVA